MTGSFLLTCSAAGKEPASNGSTINLLISVHEADMHHWPHDMPNLLIDCFTQFFGKQIGDRIETGKRPYKNLNIN